MNQRLGDSMDRNGCHFQSLAEETDILDLILERILWDNTLERVCSLVRFRHMDRGNAM